MFSGRRWFVDPFHLSRRAAFENRLVAARLVETIRRERISVLAAVPRVHALLKTYLESTLPGLTDVLERNRQEAGRGGQMVGVTAMCIALLG